MYNKVRSFSHSLYEVIIYLSAFESFDVGNIRKIKYNRFLLWYRIADFVIKKNQYVLFAQSLNHIDLEFYFKIIYISILHANSYWPNVAHKPGNNNSNAWYVSYIVVYMCSFEWIGIHIHIWIYVDVRSVVQKRRRLRRPYDHDHHQSSSLCGRDHLNICM